MSRFCGIIGNPVVPAGSYTLLEEKNSCGANQLRQVAQMCRKRGFVDRVISRGCQCMCILHPTVCNKTQFP